MIVNEKNQLWENNFKKFINDFNYLKIIKEYNVCKFLLPLNKNLHILDFGCGSGENLLSLKKRGFKNLYGYDITKDLIKHEKEINFLYDQNKDLHILNNLEIDVIFFSGTLHHLGDPFEIIKNILLKIKKKNLSVYAIEPTETFLRNISEILLLKTVIGKIFFKNLVNCLEAEWETYKPWTKINSDTIKNNFEELGFKNFKYKKTLFNIEFESHSF
jgi:2-polyprenyl-3-methyl-5-hydroxy-6-metoxy-1,4-benzoquinol methylase